MFEKIVNAVSRFVKPAVKVAGGCGLAAALAFGPMSAPIAATTAAVTSTVTMVSAGAGAVGAAALAAGPVATATVTVGALAAATTPKAMATVTNMPDPSIIYTELASPFSSALTWVIGAIAVLAVIGWIRKAIRK